MTNKLLPLILLSLISLPLALQAQSIHQSDYEAYKTSVAHPSFFADTDYTIIPIQEKKSSQLTHTIFGYLPDWEYPDAREYLQYDLLTHIAVFDFKVAANGDITPPSYWPWIDVINTAHEHGVKIIMTIVNFTTSQIHTLLTNQTSRQNLFENIKQTINEFDLQGVNIDFENIASADRGSLLNSFMADLTDYIHTEVAESEISFAAPPVNWGGWNFAGLAHSCDYIFIMGYNFYGGWSQTSGPGAPLRGGSYNITNTIENQYAAVTNSEPEKLILGVPYYGIRWQTKTSSPYSNTISFEGYPRYRIAYEESLTHELKWDRRSQTSWFPYNRNNKSYQIWFENDASLGLKYELVKKHELKGAGMWALGYDSRRSELWDELSLKFTETTGVEQDKNNKTIQIYPNPAKELLIINYPVQSLDIMRGTIINIQGKVMLDFERNTNQSLVDISILPKGLYFVRIGSATIKFMKN